MEYLDTLRKKTLILFVICKKITNLNMCESVHIKAYLNAQVHPSFDFHGTIYQILLKHIGRFRPKLIKLMQNSQ